MDSDESDLAPGRPLISVCVPMYNNGETIARCLRSIVEQDGDFELLVIDDASLDDSVAIAKTILRPTDRLIRNESNLGQEGNHVRCFEIVRGQYIQFVHGDDYLLPGALSTLARCFDDPTVGLAFTPRQLVTDDLEWLKKGRTLHTEFRRLEYRNDGLSLVRQLARAGFGENWIGEPTNVMFRRSVAVEAGGIYTDVFAGDLELWLRLLLRSAACFVPQELSVRCQRVYTPEALRKYWLDHIRILTWMIVDPLSPPDVRLIAAMWWPLAWLGQVVHRGINGPDRLSSLRILARTPFREYVRARRFRDLRGGQR